MALGEDGGEDGKVRAFKLDGAHGEALDCDLPCLGDGGEELEGRTWGGRRRLLQGVPGKGGMALGLDLSKKVMSLTIWTLTNS